MIRDDGGAPDYGVWDPRQVLLLVRYRCVCGPYLGHVQQKWSPLKIQEPPPLFLGTFVQPESFNFCRVPIIEFAVCVQTFMHFNRCPYSCAIIWETRNSNKCESLDFWGTKTLSILWYCGKVRCLVLFQSTVWCGVAIMSGSSV